MCPTIRERAHAVVVRIASRITKLKFNPITIDLVIKAIAF